MKRSEALAYRHRIESAAELQSDEQAVENINLFPSWKIGINVTIGQRYKYLGILYKAIQAHKTQSDWTPDKTPALFKVVSLEEWPEWVQPIGAVDAYMKGDKVAHNEKHWESSIDNNVWEPGIYGWIEV